MEKFKLFNGHQELGNPAKILLIKLLDKPRIPRRRFELKNLSGMNDKVLQGGIKQLLRFKLIVQKGKYFSLSKKYLLQIGLIARKQSDKMNIDSYPISEIIKESSINSKTSVYGLRSDLFCAIDKKNNLDNTKEETFQFQRGITAKEVMGNFFGVPFEVKLKNDNKDYDEARMIEDTANYYVQNFNLDKENLSESTIKRIKEVLVTIIYQSRTSSVEFAQIGENVTTKLVQLKKDQRGKELNKTYQNLLKQKHNSKSKEALSKFKEEFVSILNNGDFDVDWLTEIVFVFYGIGLNGNQKLSCEEELDRNNQFAKTVNSLAESERESLIDFLMSVAVRNASLYPTHVSFISRVNSSDSFASLRPRPRRKSKSSKEELTEKSI